MNRLLLLIFASFLGAFQPNAKGGSADFFNPWSHNTSAVDAKGIRHNGSAYKGSPPWLIDRVAGPGPDYPIEARRMRYEGRTIVRLTLDINTGHVVKARLLQSSGFQTLDNSAIKAFSQWTWQPGKWKEIDMPVTFRLGAPPATPPRGSIPLPRS